MYPDLSIVPSHDPCRLNADNCQTAKNLPLGVSCGYEMDRMHVDIDLGSVCTPQLV